MNPIGASVSRPYTVAVAVILALLFGLLALRDIPVQLKPEVDTPRITITTGFRGASAVEVEEQLTRELEEVLQSVEGIVEMVSDSSEGLSNITLEFDYGTNTQLAVVDVINKMSRIERMPPEADEPTVTIFSGTEQEHVMWIALRTGYAANEVRRIVEEEVRARIERVAGVASLLVVGGSEREIQVRIDPDLMVARGVTFDELLSGLARGNVNLRGGTVETDTRQLIVRTVGRVIDPQALADIIVDESEGGSVRLGEVATVVDGYREATGFVNMEGEPGVAIGVSRKAGTNVVQLVASLDEALAETNRVFANRGFDLFLEVVYRETTYIEDALEFVTDNLLLGAALAVGVLLLFLRSVRSVLVVSLSIPVSLVTVFIVMHALDRTVNVISLAGIAFASGMVVDSAIVVLENVFRHLEAGRSAVRAAVEGGREVWGGVLASTLTTVAVFVPILLQEDEASAIFADMALAISAAVMLSLLVALTVVPVLASLLFRGGGSHGPEDESGPGKPTALIIDEDPRLGPLNRLYTRFTDSLSAPGASPRAGKLGFVLLVVAASLVSVRLMPPAEYLPTGSRNLIFFFAAPIPGTRPEAVRDNFKPFEDFILAQPETKNVFAVTGPFFNGGGAILHREHGNPDTLADYYARLMGPAMSLAGFLFVVPIRSSLFEEAGKAFEVELSGPDLDVLEAAANGVMASIQALPGVNFVRSSLVTGRPQLTVTIDEHRAKDLGLDVNAVGNVVETVVAGRRLSAIVDGGREVDVNVVAPQQQVASPDDLADVRFLAPDDRIANLASVASVTRTLGPQSIRRLERERNVLLTVDIAPDAPLETVVQRVESEVLPPESARLGPAYTLGVGGAADKLRATLDALTAGFGLSVLIVYLLLVALFRSWFTPFVILLTVPLALTGGLLGIRIAHELSGGQAAFDVIAMLGFVILAGLVVNNAILIVHQANNFRDEGLDPRRALALAARSRLRPILMTVITTVTAMMPLAIGGGAGAELYQGLGAVIVGGLLVSTLFTLFLVPVLLSLGQDLHAWWQPRRASAPANPPIRAA